ncbi:MAG: hypothetical protein P4M05_13350 [Bradyrhizobium sp.]|nr:hypothetical protein [Bradyrhizobium sp.]
MRGKTDELKMEALDTVTGGDDMGDMSEMLSMRLQMAMDNRSKFVESLSNIMKEMSNTASQITKNLK